MEDNDKIINVFTHNQVIAPDRLRRYVGDFLLLILACFLVLSFAFFVAFEKMPPSSSTASASDIATISLKIALHKASGGIAFSKQAPAILDAIERSEAAAWITAKAYLAMALAACLSVYANRKKLIAKRGYTHIRGSQLHRGKAAEKRLKNKLAAGDELYIFPGLKVAPSALGAGMLVIGSAGSGKTVILSPYIDALMKQNQKLISLDCKAGEQLLKWPKAHYIAPWLRGSLIPDVGRDCATESECFAFAEALIKSVPGKGEIWSKAASATVGGLVLSLAEKNPLAWGWQDLADILDEPVAVWIQRIKEVKPGLLAIIDSGSDTTTGSVIFTIAAELKSLSQVSAMFAEGAKHGGRLFSFKEWLKNPVYEIRQIILCFEASHPEVKFLAPWIIDSIAQAIGSLNQGTSDRKYLMLDEFAQLPAVNIDPFFEIGRSFGLQTVIACQDFSQVIKTFGKERAATIFGNASVKLICQITMSEQQKIISDALGQREVSHIATSLSGSGIGIKSSSTSTQEKLQSVILPGELGTDLKVIFDGKKPKAVRALLIPFGADGGAYMLDFPATLIGEKKRQLLTLPSLHQAIGLFKLAMKQNKPIADRIDDVKTAAESAAVQMTDYDLCGMLYSAGFIDKTQWNRARAKGGAAIALAELKAKREPAEGVGYPMDGVDEKIEEVENVSIEKQEENVMETSQNTAEDHEDNDETRLMIAKHIALEAARAAYITTLEMTSKHLSDTDAEAIAIAVSNATASAAIADAASKNGELPIDEALKLADAFRSKNDESIESETEKPMLRLIPRTAEEN